MEEDEKTRTCIFKQREKIEEKEGRERGRVKEIGIERGRGKKGACRRLIDDRSCVAGSESVIRNIKINNISAVRYRYYYRAGAVACGVCFGSYGGLILRDPILDPRYSYTRGKYTPMYICV